MDERGLTMNFVTPVCAVLSAVFFLLGIWVLVAEKMFGKQKKAASILLAGSVVMGLIAFFVR